MKATELMDKLKCLIDTYGDSNIIFHFVTYEFEADREITNIAVSDNYEQRTFIIEE